VRLAHLGSVDWYDVLIYFTKSNNFTSRDWHVFPKGAARSASCGSPGGRCGPPPAGRTRASSAAIIGFFGRGYRWGELDSLGLSVLVKLTLAELLVGWGELEPAEQEFKLLVGPRSVSIMVS